jgi:hypothetical protein
LETVRDEVNPGIDVPFSDPVITRYRDTNANLRPQMLRIMRRAGVEPWQRLFHNLRASRQTELADQFPSHVVADWLGNSQAIADRHYLQTTEAHFRRACSEPTGALQNPVQLEAELARDEPQDKNKPLAIFENCEGLSTCIGVHIPPRGFEPLSPP